MTYRSIVACHISLSRYELFTRVFFFFWRGWWFIFISNGHLSFNRILKYKNMVSTTCSFMYRCWRPFAHRGEPAPWWLRTCPMPGQVRTPGFAPSQTTWFSFHILITYIANILKRLPLESIDHGLSDRAN